MKETNVYTLNPDYALRKDKNRIFITNSSNSPLVEDFVGFVHPVFAVMLSLFNGEKTLHEVLDHISRFLSLRLPVVTNLITPLIENEKPKSFKYDGYQFSFPKMLIIKKKDYHEEKKFDFKSFLIPSESLDMKSFRFHRPMDGQIMINGRCVSDCIYCYADKKMNLDCQIPLKRIKEIIREARFLEMRSFDITGGEFFLYRHWEEFLAELLDNGFNPYISTKCPLNSDTINKLENLGIKKIQVSIDSIIKNELVTILKVDGDYHKQILNTLKNLDERGFQIYTNSQINAINQENFNKLLEFLLKLNNIKRINIGAAGFSLYKGEIQYRQYKPNLQKVKEIKAAVDELKNEYHDRVNINFSGYNEKEKIIDRTFEDKQKDFNTRPMCSGNVYGFLVLPDGKVTICEELYWHPHFIIGDLTKQSIEEVWNSEKAFKLYHISQEMIRDESGCKTCHEFDECHRNKGVCWKEVLYAYGYHNWDYPDPKCPYAPKPFREYYL